MRLKRPEQKTRNNKLETLSAQLGARCVASYRCASLRETIERSSNAAQPETINQKQPFECLRASK